MEPITNQEVARWRQHREELLAIGVPDRKPDHSDGGALIWSIASNDEPSMVIGCRTCTPGVWPRVDRGAILVIHKDDRGEPSIYVEVAADPPVIRVELASPHEPGVIMATLTRWALDGYEQVVVPGLSVQS